MKNILLIATGGTIASKDNGNGLTPSIDVNILLDYIPVIRQKCHVTGISLMNIDSSNMDTSHISSISECIMNNYNDYDGFVITHGTDTCAYTAAALSYQLINLSKPVILTGSQLPIDVEKTDAVMNLTNAFIYSCEDISGVFLAFSEKLIKGTCAKKIKTKSFDAFESINFPYIATIRNNIVEYNINTFENKYGDYLSQEQLAREYFVNTGTVTSWIKKGKIKPSVEYKFGSKSLYLFSPDDVEKYRNELGIKEHNNNTIKQDFFEFLEERDYSLSYKMPFLLAFIKNVNTIGDAKIDDVLNDYIAFYQDRIDRGLQVDRSTCPYNETMLQDRKAICRNMLTNPFEKFERKRFLYYSKDLSIIAMNHALYSKMNKEDWDRVKSQMQKDLAHYYSDMDGM